MHIWVIREFLSVVLLVLREVLIKSGMQIAQTDFSSDCMKMTQEYLMYFKEVSCNMTKNKQVRCMPRFIQRFLSIIHLSIKFFNRQKLRFDRQNEENVRISPA